MNLLYRDISLNGKREKLGTGWLPPLPDLRDYTEDHPEVKMMTKKLAVGSVKKARKYRKKTEDLREWCSPIENQKSLGSCTANAAVGIVEYFENRAFGKHIDGSRLFVYKATRNLMGVTGDTGAWLRNTMGALTLCGVPPEKYWPYTDKTEPDSDDGMYFDSEPPSFVYAVADNYEAIKYFCHDPLGGNRSGKDVLESVKRYLRYGIPSMFGFYGFSSFDESDVPGGIPYPRPEEHALWGHAIVAVGYDDNLEIKNLRGGKPAEGALLIRNSWGEDWGDEGYGWLPYDYVTTYLALDFWSLLSMEWVDTKKFG